MQRQGHYPRPEGYVDPEVLRLRQQADEERELAEAVPASSNSFPLSFSYRKQHDVRHLRRHPIMTVH